MASSFGTGIGIKQLYVLASGNVLTPINTIEGGRYIWRAEATNWAGATATLQFLNLDGKTFTSISTVSQNSSIALDIGQGTTVIIILTGSPTNFNSTLGGY